MFLTQNACVYLSASTSRTVRPSAQLFTIQAVSKAARKPLAQPVPMGQKGCIGIHNKCMNIVICQCTLKLWNYHCTYCALNIGKHTLSWFWDWHTYWSSKTKHYRCSNIDRHYIKYIQWDKHHTIKAQRIGNKSRMGVDIVEKFMFGCGASVICLERKWAFCESRFPFGKKKKIWPDESEHPSHDCQIV